MITPTDQQGYRFLDCGEKNGCCQAEFKGTRRDAKDDYTMVRKKIHGKMRNNILAIPPFHPTTQTVLPS